jgi:osmotically-inducible protein OsmY
MNGLRHILMAMVAAFALSGCVVVISEDGISTADSAHANGNARDRAVAGRVRDAYAADAELRDADISVAAHDGTVTLRGELTRVADLERAVTLAKDADGVDKVVSRLKLEVR